MKAIRKKGMGAMIAAGILLSALAMETSMRPDAEEAQPYHERVRRIAETMPMHVGPWTGSDIKSPTEAIKLLKPNVIISRQYYNVDTNRSVSFLLVHCRDAQDLYGHYPPSCYPANGMELRDSWDENWQVGKFPIEGICYQFDEQRLGTGGKLVDNFIIVPGRYVRDMAAVGSQAGDYTRRYFGAAQVQIVYDNPSRWTDAERREVFQTLIQAYMPLFEEIRRARQVKP